MQRKKEIKAVTDSAFEIHPKEETCFKLYRDSKSFQEIFIKPDCMVIVPEITNCHIVFIRHQPTDRYWIFHVSPNALSQATGQENPAYAEIEKVYKNTALGLKKTTKLILSLLKGIISLI